MEKYCEVTGNPVPAVKWLKGEQPINWTVPLSRENAGTYVIEAEGAIVTKKDIQVLISCEFPVMSHTDCLGFFIFVREPGYFFIMSFISLKKTLLELILKYKGNVFSCFQMNQSWSAQAITLRWSTLLTTSPALSMATLNLT